ncbi:SPOR domain-containing protein [Rhodohalobacter sp.]|uniref:SPOR domain-containing protein n=1 Tax=Rhodohalobacter sp. TaxID=1974210 RepID=UPI002ACD35E3|nr:SPOR domain-containing protein [Rhodohalobacter sp.]MDZ7755003.1 SPOR domain-containing protein [Rhodohalobacter sp.]
MKINRAKLIELLVDKTGMEADEIESQLKQLIDRILDAAERGKALEVKEFGMFYFDENGDLKFDPSDELSTEINFKYAGMEPVELKPARDQDSDAQANDLSYEEEADETEDEPASSTGSDMDEIFGFNVDDQNLEEEDEGPIEDEEEGPDGGALISPPDKVDRDIDPFSGLLGDASSKMKDSDDKDKDEDEDKDDPFSFISEEYEEAEDDTEKEEEFEPIPESDVEEDDDLESEPVFALDDEEEIDDEFEDDDSDDLSKIFDEPEPKSEPESSDSSEEVAPEPDFVVAKTKDIKKDTKSKITKEKSEQRDPITLVISIGLIIILIVIGFLVIPSLFESDDSGTEVVTDPPEEQVDTTPEETQSVVTPSEPEEETEVTEEESVQPEPEQPVYGLMGDLVDEANDGYSVVLHSMQSEVRARSEAADLASEGYRVLVSPRLVDGSTVWRVSVGQFPTIPEAQQAAAELPSPYSTNNFIQRIQTN